MFAYLLSALIATYSPQRPEEAIAYWTTIPESHVQYKESIEELMKATYELSQWPRFFAYAAYYRNKFPKKSRTEVQLLEGLALLRHCQNRKLEEFIDQTKEDFPPWNESLDQMAALAKTRFEGKRAPKGKQVRPGFVTHWEGKERKPLASTSSLQKISPHTLMIKVENLCAQ